MVLDQTILTRFVEFLEDRPTDEEILKFKATEAEEQRFNRLLVIAAANNLEIDEEYELEDIKRSNHVVSLAKIRAYGRMNRAKSE